MNLQQTWQVIAIALTLVWTQAELPAVISGTNAHPKMATWRGTKKVQFRITPEESAEQVRVIMQSIDNSISLLTPEDLAKVTKSVQLAFPKGSAPPSSDDRAKTLAWISDRLTKAIQETHNDLGPHPGFLHASAAVSKTRVLIPELKCIGKAHIKIGEGLLVSHISLKAAPKASVAAKNHQRAIAAKEVTIRGTVAIQVKVVMKLPGGIEIPGDTTFASGIQDVKISKKGTKEEDLTFKKEPAKLS